MMMPCSRTSSQPQRPTPPPHLDQRDRSGRTPLAVHLQLGLESNLSTKGTRKTYAIKIIKDHAKAQIKAFLRLSNYYIVKAL